MKVKVLISVLVLALVPVCSWANVCDDINDVANGWNDIANFVDELDLSQITEEDAAYIDSAIGEAIDATRELADALEEYGNNTEAGMGRNVNRDLDVLVDSETMDEIVESMGAVVDSLDLIVDYCDEQ